MSVPEPRRAATAVAIAAVGMPCALLAHLLATGRPASAPAAGLALVAVLVVAALLPARRSGGLALVTAVAQLAAHTVLAAFAVPGAGGHPACLPAVGRAASLGLHLAVFSTDGGCPAGTLAVAPAAVTALTALLTAWVILAGHAAVALLAGHLLGRALDAGDVLACLARFLDEVLARTAALLTALAAGLAPVTGAAPRRRPTPADQVLPPPARTPGAVSRRGPPRRALPAT